MPASATTTRTTKRRSVMFLSAVVLTSGACLAGAQGSLAVGSAEQSSDTLRLVVKAGQTKVISDTTVLHHLTVEPGATIAAPEGHVISLTVNSRETGQKITPTGATYTTIQPGTYRGLVVLTVAEANPVVFDGKTYQFRQALYIDRDGVDQDRSVLSAVVGRAGQSLARNIAIASTGEAFNGVFVADTDYTLKNLRIALTGNGRSDFAGMGAAVMGTGTATDLVVDGATIMNKGAVRPAIVAAGGANVIVKNSTIRTQDGTLPDDYASSVNLSYMQDAPWMLGISGNNRATNVLGENTKATYISSSITSENWGALSTDVGQNMKLSAINSVVANSGHDGYGSYVIGNATERFLGTTFDVATYASIITGGSLAFGDSTKAAVSALNRELGLQLTPADIARLPVKATTITSDRFGIMWHNRGSVDISGGTSIRTKETLFLNKGQQATVTVDGSQGASLKPANGVLYQLMDNDDPGPDFANGMLNNGVYHEPTTPVVKNTSFDVTAQHPTDAVTTFSRIALTGDLFNAYRGDIAGMGPAQPRNLVVALDRATLKGTVSASTAAHNQTTITSADYRQLGVVHNTPAAVVNNGVLVSLARGSVWTVTGTSHLSSLTLDRGSSVRAPYGKSLTATVNGVATTVKPGQTYTGAIVLSVS